MNDRKALVYELALLAEIGAGGWRLRAKPGTLWGAAEAENERMSDGALAPRHGRARARPRLCRRGLRARQSGRARAIGGGRDCARSRGRCRAYLMSPAARNRSGSGPLLDEVARGERLGDHTELGEDVDPGLRQARSGAESRTWFVRFSRAAPASISTYFARILALAALVPRLVRPDGRSLDRRRGSARRGSCRCRCGRSTSSRGTVLEQTASNG